MNEHSVADFISLWLVIHSFEHIVSLEIEPFLCSVCPSCELPRGVSGDSHVIQRFGPGNGGCGGLSSLDRGREQVVPLVSTHENEQNMFCLVRVEVAASALVSGTSRLCKLIIEQK